MLATLTHLHGKKAWQSVNHIVERLANILNIDQNHIYIASTGVTAVSLPENKIIDMLPQLCSRQQTQDSWQHAAKAIMTTDTFAKAATTRCTVGNKTYMINGIAKGSGMIAPNMATMLAFIFTDACIPQQTLQKMLVDTTATSFNAITVDSDMSPSDTVFLSALGSTEPLSNPHHLAQFQQALHHVMCDLAQQIVKDGEGAQKFITVHVVGARTINNARTIAFAIAESPLVKTAIAGGDPNWGRILMAIGKAKQGVKQDAIAISFNDMPITPNEPEKENALKRLMQQKDIAITINLNDGKSQFTVWTCDFTHDYITINAQYRT